MASSIVRLWQSYLNNTHPVFIATFPEQNSTHEMFHTKTVSTKNLVLIFKKNVSTKNSPHPYTSWWFQPIWKNISQKMGSSSPNVGMKIKNMWVATTWYRVLLFGGWLFKGPASWGLVFQPFCLLLISFNPSTHHEFPKLRLGPKIPRNTWGHQLHHF